MIWDLFQIKYKYIQKDMIMENDKIKDILKSSNSYDEASKKCFGYSNGKSITKLRNFVFFYAIDVSHFSNKKRKNKYQIITKVCPVCGTSFNTKLGIKKEKITCSYACSNIYFRSGENNGNWKDDAYRSTCFLHHKKECIICGEKNIVSVHHMDHNHDNNSPENLVPLCPTHHQYLHSNYSYLIIDKVKKYIEEFNKE